MTEPQDLATIHGIVDRIGQIWLPNPLEPVESNHSKVTGVDTEAARYHHGYHHSARDSFFQFAIVGRSTTIAFGAMLW